MNTSGKATRRVVKTDSTVLLREKYTRRISALRRFTDNLQKGYVPDEAEVESLRSVGVSEQEIRALVAQYRS